MPSLRSLHFDVQIISRGQRKSAVASASYRSGKRLKVDAPMRSAIAAASYRSGEALYDEQEQRTFDYTRKEDIRYSEILAPKNAPAWVKSREKLWNIVEALEKRKDAQLARDVIAVFPRELSFDECKAMLTEFINDNFVSKGMVADFSIHEANASDGGKNPHAHIMLTMREIDANGFGKKNREWNDQKLVTRWRKSWEDYSNRHLEKAGFDVRVTLQSYENLGVDKMPGVHMGAEQWNLEQKGAKTQKGNKNREVKHENVLQDSLDVAEEAGEHLDTQWEALIETLNPEPERQTPMQALESESVLLSDSANDTAAIDYGETVSPLTETGNVGDGLQNLNTATIHGRSAGEAELAHREQVEAYVSSDEFDNARKETGRMIAMKRYASRFVDMAKELSTKAYRQFSNLIRETIRERDRDNGYER